MHLRAETTRDTLHEIKDMKIDRTETPTRGEGLCVDERLEVLT